MNNERERERKGLCDWEKDKIRKKKSIGKEIEGREREIQDNKLK